MKTEREKCFEQIEYRTFTREDGSVFRIKRTKFIDNPTLLEITINEVLDRFEKLEKIKELEDEKI